MRVAGDASDTDSTTALDTTTGAGGGATGAEALGNGGGTTDAGGMRSAASFTWMIA